MREGTIIICYFNYPNCYVYFNYHNVTITQIHYVASHSDVISTSNCSSVDMPDVLVAFEYTRRTS